MARADIRAKQSLVRDFRRAGQLVLKGARRAGGGAGLHCGRGADAGRKSCSSPRPSPIAGAPMTEKECLAAGIAVSLFAHFALLIAPRPPEPEPSFTTVVQMDMASPAVATSREKGIGIAAASPRDMDKADAADRKRQAFLRYLDDIDEAVHARRLDGGETGLIGVAEYMFTVRPDGTFTDPVLRASSGSPELDASARRAVLAASGKVRRPAIIGTEPIPVILHVKYQYGLR
ncbi:MAG: energy transducer TonB [Bilophila wadsworthia]